MLLLSLASYAQYALTESGGLLSAGVALPVGSNNVKLGPSVGAGAFFTKFRCGKRDGFWLEGLVRYLQTQDEAPDTATLAFSAPPTPDAAALTYSFLQLDLGAYYKIRFQNYHQRKELAFLIGPKLSYRLTANAEGNTFESDAYRTVHKGYLGVHVSAIYRLPAGNRYSLFLGGGGEYFFGNAVSTTSDPKFRYANLFLRVGYVFWNTR